MIHSCNIRRNLFMRNKKLLLGIGIMCCLWCLPKIVHGKENKVSFSLVELKCENMVDPLGIDNVTPHLSWKLKGDGVVDGQAFYEIQVASDSLLLIGGKADLWKSGKLKSDVSVMVPYQGLPLASRSLCYWRGGENVITKFQYKILKKALKNHAARPVGRDRVLSGCYLQSTC